MGEPATCPICSGRGWVPGERYPVVCHGCRGKGVVDLEEASAEPEDDPHELEE